MQCQEYAKQSTRASGQSLQRGACGTTSIVCCGSLIGDLRSSQADKPTGCWYFLVPLFDPAFCSSVISQQQTLHLVLNSAFEPPSVAAFRSLSIHGYLYAAVSTLFKSKTFVRADCRSPKCKLAKCCVCFYSCSLQSPASLPLVDTDRQSSDVGRYGFSKPRR